MQLTTRQQAIIIGTLLGDGCLERRDNHVRLRIDHGVDQRQYVGWKYANLKNISRALPHTATYFHEKHGKTYTNVRFSTLAHPELNGFWKDFYPHGRKIIPKNLQRLLQHPLSLAVWFMDDGYKRNDCNAFRLNTDMFRKHDQLRLVKILRENFSLESTLHKKGNYWNVYIPSASAKKFADIVRPYILPSFKYKIALAP